MNKKLLEEDVSEMLEFVEKMLSFSRVPTIERSNALAKAEEHHNMMLDINHKIELLETTEEELLQLAYDLQYNNRERRVAKDSADYWEMYANTFDTDGTRTLLTRLRDSLRALKKEIKGKQERVYVLRGPDKGTIFREYGDDYVHVDLSQRKEVKVRPNARNIRRKNKLQGGRIR